MSNMETSELFKKHFSNVYGGNGVGIFHPNMEAFFTELNETILKEDAEKKQQSQSITVKLEENERS